MGMSKENKHRRSGKHSYFRMLFGGMWQAKSRILAIFGIVALGVGFLFGIVSTTPDMQYSADAYYDRTNMMDLRIVSTLGFTKDDIDAIAAADDVLDASGGYSADAVMFDGESTYVTLIHSIPSAAETWLNRAELKSGRMPKSADECVVEVGSAVLSVSFDEGTTLELDNPSEYEGILTVDGFTVVGTVSSARYFSIEKESSTKGNGQVGLIVYTVEDAFAYEAYTVAYVRSASALALNCFDDEYDETVKKLTESIESVTSERRQARYDEVKAQYTAAIEDGETRISMAKTRLTLAQNLLGAQQKDVRELEEILAVLPVGGIYTDGRTYAEIAEELEGKKANVEKLTGQIVEGLQTVSNGEASLLAAREALEELEEPKWYFYDRYDNPGFNSFSSNSEKIAAIAKIFPVFFFLVALLVSLTTMTRMVDEERGIIGTMKALGYSNAAISFRYLFYAAAAGILGSALGLSVGSRVFPLVLYNAYSMMYTLPPLSLLFDVKLALVSSISIISLTLLATYLACRASLSETPAQLLLPKAPKIGKRIFLEHIKPVWSRMKFTHKVTARNILLYKKRFFMTVIGIAGCTALLLAGFGLRDSIGEIVDLQYGDIFKYNLMIVRYDDNYTEEFDDFLTDNGVESFVSVSMQRYGISDADGKELVNAYCLSTKDADNVNNFIDMRSMKSGEKYVFTENSVFITQKLAELLGVSDGDTVNVDCDGQLCELRVDAVVENYLNSYVYIGNNVLPEPIAENSTDNIIFAYADASDKEARDTIASTLLANDEILSVNFTDGLSESFDNMISKINYIVYVLIIAAGALAFIVLYNLININIAERMREIATIKVLGFYDREVYSYVFREIGILTLIGALAGLVVGVFLHRFVIKTAEMEMVMFSRTIEPASFLLAILLTAVFCIIVSWVMTKKLKSINMVESLKSNE